MSIHFQNKVIKLASNDIFKSDDMVLKPKEKYFKIAPSEKCNFRKSIPLHNILSAHDQLPLWYTAKKILMYVL